MGAEGHLFSDLPGRALRPLRMKKSNQMGPLIVPKRTLIYRGPPERMARSFKHVSGPPERVKGH